MPAGPRSHVAACIKNYKPQELCLSKGKCVQVEAAPAGTELDDAEQRRVALELRSMYAAAALKDVACAGDLLGTPPPPNG